MNYETHKLTDVRYKCNRSLLFKINDFPHLATVYILIIYEWIADLNLFIFLFHWILSLSFSFIWLSYSTCNWWNSKCLWPSCSKLGGGGTFRIIWIAGKFRHYMQRRSPRRHVYDPLFMLWENVSLILFIQNWGTSVYFIMLFTNVISHSVHECQT